MQIQYQKKFLKDLASITSKSRQTIENLVFNTFSEYENIEKSGKLEKLKEYNSYFKIRVGNYRIGSRLKMIFFLLRESYIEKKSTSSSHK
ncbi:MAG: hypothetical protein IE931_11870 [Sphingobacteriales bacterium]|nr:hypothetical protein [Sphingobacteriales bacterium]